MTDEFLKYTEKVLAGAADIEQARLYFLAPIKAVDDWTVEIRAVPYGVDSDGQTFDAGTDYMLDTFASPAILYHHGVMPGSNGGKLTLQDKPIVIGKSVKVEQRSDGVYITAVLDKAVEYARRVWEAAKKGIAVASSDSIAHLARLDIGGKRQMYDKSKPGRIAVWPLAGVSLWDHVEGNFHPASRNAVALPAMKAIYRDAGLPFPEVTDDVLPEAEQAAKRSRKEQILKNSQAILKKKGS